MMDFKFTVLELSKKIVASLRDRPGKEVMNGKQRRKNELLADHTVPLPETVCSCQLNYCRGATSQARPNISGTRTYTDLVHARTGSFKYGMPGKGVCKSQAAK